MHPLPSSSSFPPPLSLINPEKARKRFGEQAVDLLIEMTHAGDARADAVIQEAETPGSDVKRQLTRGIKEGLRCINHPSESLRAFLEETERLPDWVDPHRLQRGSEAFLSIGPIWRLLAPGAASLPPPIAGASQSRSTRLADAEPICSKPHPDSRSCLFSVHARERVRPNSLSAQCDLPRSATIAASSCAFIRRRKGDRWTEHHLRNLEPELHSGVLPALS
jgi:hypothetical protein